MILWITAAWAGAWTRDFGALYAKAGADLYRPFTFVMPGDDEAYPGTYLGQQYGMYAEVGVSPGHPVQVSIALPVGIGTVNTTTPEALGSIPLRATTARAGDLRIAVQTALHPTAPVSAAVEAKIPLYANGQVGADYPTFAPLFPKPGDGQVDLTGWVAAGLPLGSTGFGEVALGYRHRTEQFVGWLTPLRFVDGLTYAAKAGRRFGRVTPIAGVDGVVNLQSDTRTRQYTSLSGTALIDVAEGWAVEPRVAGEILARNTSRGVGVGVGLSYRR